MTRPIPVPVAATPSPGAPTYTQIITDADTASTPWIDDTTPPGHFGVTVRNIGGVQTYWFAGDVNNPADAPVVARTQTIHGRLFHYVGGRILGGTLTALPN